MARVDVKPDILRWAVQRTGKADEIYKHFPKLVHWINNESQPTLKQLEQLAKATSTPLGYFFLTKPPLEQLPIPYYRTIGDHQTPHPSPELLETVQTMERRQHWMRDYLIEMGQEPLYFVGSASIHEGPKNVARKMKSVLGLERGWAAERGTWEDALRILLTKIEDIGIFVVVNGLVGNNTHRKLDVTEFRGFVLVDEYAPFIFVNGADGKAAQMFTLAHELAHIWFGASAAFDLQQLQPSHHEIERACNQAAAEFLVPERELRQVWTDVRVASDRYQRLARHFKVSELVAARRALDLELIAKNDFFEFYQTYMKRVYQERDQDSGGGNFYASQNWRIGRRFAETVIGAAKEGKLLYREAYRLTGLHGKTFSKYAERLGFGVRT